MFKNRNKSHLKNVFNHSFLSFKRPKINPSPKTIIKALIKLLKLSVWRLMELFFMRGLIPFCWFHIRALLEKSSRVSKKILLTINYLRTVKELEGSENLELPA